MMNKYVVTARQTEAGPTNPVSDLSWVAKV
jgi:hypothetical protein